MPPNDKVYPELRAIEAVALPPTGDFALAAIEHRQEATANDSAAVRPFA